jgi:pimeloyl-ACP methyl ester carboxylesterase
VLASARSMAPRMWPLAVVIAAALGLTLSGAVPVWSGLVHVVALPPLDLALDLRFLVARSPSYSLFLAGVAVSLVVRSMLLGAILVGVGLVPSFGPGIARAAKLYALALVPLAVAGALEFAGLAAVYAMYAWVGLTLTLLVAILFSPRALAQRGTRLQRIPLVLVYLAAVAGVGALARLTEPWGVFPAVIVSAGLTGFMVVRLARPAPERGVHAAAAVILAASLHAPPVHHAQVQPDAVLLVVPGVDTMSGLGAGYRLDPSALGFSCDRVFYFSYRGPDPGEVPQGQAPCPIRLHQSYFPPATQRPLSELVETFGAQVEAVRTQVGEAPIVVVTHSQGAAIAWRAVAEGRAPGVTHLIGLAGFSHSPVGYPPPWEDGPGRIGADALRVLSWVSRLMGFGSFEPDAPLPRELLARSDGLESIFAQPLPSGVRTALLFSTADLIAAPQGHSLPHGLTTTIDATHVGIVTSVGTVEAIRQILGGGSPSGGTVLAALIDPCLPPWLPPPA